MKAKVLVELDITKYIRKQDLPQMDGTAIKEFLQDTPEILDEINSGDVEIKFLKGWKE